MTSNSWIRLSGVVAVALIIFASLFLPAKWEQLRTGHWAVEHFLAFFAATLIICLGWSRPFVVAGLLMPFAALLEALQYFTPTHTPDLLAVLSGAGGALAAALLAKFIILVRNRPHRLGPPGGLPPRGDS
jgi:VanZ family protein